MKETVLVSACLLGLKTRYDGTDALNAPAIAALKGKNPVPVCPEQLGGLPTPRPCSVIVHGSGPDILNNKTSVVDANGLNITEAFIKGANETLKIAKITDAKKAYLKEKSPSCGVNLIYNKGNVLVEGMGVTAALLARSGIKITGF